jgi:hypothetical protein
VTLTATDTLSGVSRTEYRVGSGNWTEYAGPFTLGDDGIHAVGFRSVDRAGNIEVESSLLVRIDTVVPEARLRFDPQSGDVLVFGQDGGAGVTAGAAIPDIRLPLAPPAKGERRTYTLTDAAGNALTLALDVWVEGQHVRASVSGLAYNGVAAPLDLNTLQMTSTSDRSGALRTAEVRLTVGRGGLAQSLGTSYNGQVNRTVVIERTGTTTAPGLILPELATRRGSLVLSR